MNTKKSALALSVLAPLAFAMSLNGAVTPAAALAPQTGPAITASSSVSALAAKKYTFATVKKHNTRKSCWTVIGTNVYNLTGWINKHPGGSKRIIALCGKNGTAAFRSQHGTTGRAVTVLKKYKIGVLG